MICFPGAKINIGLSVLNQRCDGYHNIQSIFYPVTQYNDCIEIIESDRFEFQNHGLAVPGNYKDNLCYKAYMALKADFNIPNVSIRLLKRIPMGAGLGGGSSDASATLLLLNELFRLKLSTKDLMEYASMLGSDCPFFISNKPARVTGRGNAIEPIDFSLKGYLLTIINPGLHISTKEAYENLKITNKRVNFKSAIQQPIGTWKELIWNDFEEYAFSRYPLIPEIKKAMYEAGALFVSMTGSGSSVYALSGHYLELLPGLEKLNKWECRL
jgi:4-diphosphocytidyl-2-C-methyl-D-erythritol kinase